MGGGGEKRDAIKKLANAERARSGELSKYRIKHKYQLIFFIQ